MTASPAAPGMPTEEEIARALNLAARAMQRELHSRGSEEDIEAVVWRYLGPAFEAKDAEIEALKKLPVVADYIEVQEARRTAEAKLAQAVEALSRAKDDVARYRWLRDGNAYAPEEDTVDGGEELDALCDRGIRSASAAARGETHE